MTKTSAATGSVKRFWISTRKGVTICPWASSSATVARSCSSVISFSGFSMRWAAL
jgi:hypothetical protein